MRARLVVIALVVACRPRVETGAPCSTVAHRFDSVVRAELGSGLPDAVRRGAETQLAGITASLERLCTEGKWSAAVRDCIVLADDRVALEACEQKLTDDQRAALDR
jgi:hypothetical protein